MNRKIIIGSRGSQLALWQAHFVQSELEKNQILSEIKIIKTKGDKIQNLSFDKIEGKGFFTKEIEDALLNQEIDLAVHSCKDLPTESPEGLKIASYSYREDPADLLLIRKEKVDSKKILSLPENAIVGTSSARRKSQILAFRPDLILKDIRGNVPTRIEKLRQKNFDAILLAQAGIARLELDLSDFEAIRLNPTYFIPAPAQGVLALQIRENDLELEESLQFFNHPEILENIEVERKILNQFQGGCQMPLGVYCQQKNGIFKIWTAKANSANEIPVRIFEKGKDPEKLIPKILEKANQVDPKKVFISKDLSSDSYFKRSLESKNYLVLDESLIETKAISFQDFPKTDWLFFSSPNAVKYFLDQIDLKKIKNKKIAAFGKATAQAVQKRNLLVDLIGEGSESKSIAQAFEKMLKNNSVLFPQSNISLQNIQKHLSSKQNIQNLIVYKTSSKAQIKPIEADIFIFTSPSNVQSFADKFSFNKKKTYIAIGKTTGAKLESFGIVNYEMPYLPQEVYLAECVFSL